MLPISVKGLINRALFLPRLYRKDRKMALIQLGSQEEAMCALIVSISQPYRGPSTSVVLLLTLDGLGIVFYSILPLVSKWYHGRSSVRKSAFRRLC